MTAPDLGEMLREARERHALSVETLSRNTTIPIDHIEAIEAGRVEALPRAMYRRAEIRAYAEAVGLDPDIVLTQLRLAVPRTAETADAGADVARVPEAPLIRGGVGPERPLMPLPMCRTRTNDPHQTNDTGARAGRAIVLLLVGCAALLWEQTGAPSIDVPLAPAMVTIGEVTPETIIDEAVRIAEPPPAAPTLRRAAYESRIAANGRRWPRDARLDEGVLVVHSTPRGARVTVNGVGWGVTPVAIRYLPFGTLRVRVGKADHAMQERVVQLSPDEPSRTLRVSLPALPRRRTRASAVTGGDMLVITTVPEGARVTVNGIGWGTTPLSIAHVPAGEQRVRVVKDQFRSEERILTVREGQPGHVAITLRPSS